MIVLELLAALGVMCAGIGFLVSVRLGVVTLFAAIPFALGTVQTHSFLPTLMFVSVTIGLLLRGIFDPRITVRMTPLGLAVLALSIYMIVRLLAGISGSWSLREAQVLLFFGMLPVLACLLPPALADPKLMLRALGALAASASAYYFLLTVLYFAVPASITVPDLYGNLRLMGLGGVRGAYLTSICALLVTTALFLLGQRRAWSLALGAATLVLTACVVLLSASRLAVVTICIALAIFFALERIRMSAGFSVILLSTAFLAIFAVVAVLQLPAYSARLYSLLDFETLATESRWLIYLAALQMFLDAPVFGIGIGGFVERGYDSILSQAYAASPELHESISTWLHHAPGEAHSVYLFFLVETGAVAFLILLLVLWQVLRCLRLLVRMSSGRERSMYAALTAGIIALFLHLALVNGSLHPMLWAIVVLAAATGLNGMPARTGTASGGRKGDGAHRPRDQGAPA